jgi:hypothetical protein
LTRFIWDKFSKDFLETLLSPYGTVVVSKEVTSEIKEIDVYFVPNKAEIPSQLGLLGKLSQSPCLFEPHRNPITLDSLSDCLSKRFAIREILQREAKRNKQRISEDEIPKLWIITPTASERILSLFAAQLYQFSLVVTHLLSWRKGEGGRGKARGYFLSPFTFNLFLC